MQHTLHLFTCSYSSFRQSVHRMAFSFHNVYEMSCINSCIYIVFVVGGIQLEKKFCCFISAVFFNSITRQNSHVA